MDNRSKLIILLIVLVFVVGSVGAAAYYHKNQQLQREANKAVNLDRELAERTIELEGYKEASEENWERFTAEAFKRRAAEGKLSDSEEDIARLIGRLSRKNSALNDLREENKTLEDTISSIMTGEAESEGEGTLQCPEGENIQVALKMFCKFNLIEIPADPEPKYFIKFFPTGRVFNAETDEPITDIIKGTVSSSELNIYRNPNVIETPKPDQKNMIYTTLGFFQDGEVGVGGGYSRTLWRPTTKIDKFFLPDSAKASAYGEFWYSPHETAWELGLRLSWEF